MSNRGKENQGDAQTLAGPNLLDSAELDFETIAIRTGHKRTGEQEHSEPIFTTSSFVYDSAEEAALKFSGEVPGNIYSRFTNPTVRAFEQRLAALEGGERGIATGSGMAAISTLFLSLLKAGDHIVVSRSVFGPTVSFCNNYLAKFGIETTFVTLSDPDSWRQAIQSNTRLLFLETPSNPMTEIADIALLAQMARENHCLLVVDNCFCTPALQRPLALGADIIIHSATKYLDGQGRCIGGALVGSEDIMGGDIYSYLRTAGPSLSPFNAWVFLKGLETLKLRMDAHSANALELASWLESRAEVQQVHYPGLESHPQHDLASTQQSRYGGIISFELKGGQDSAWALVNGTRLLSITANLGDTKTTITHPATTTHSRLTPEQRADAGISDGLIRIAVGLESVDDIMADLDRGFHAINNS